MKTIILTTLAALTFASCGGSSDTGPVDSAQEYWDAATADEQNEVCQNFALMGIDVIRQAALNEGASVAYTNAILEILEENC